MNKKADPGNLGNPISGIWPYQEDPPLYYRSYGDDHNYRHHAGLFDFWGMTTDEEEMYPEPNAWIKTKIPVPLGNIPSFQEILEGSEDIVDKWSGSPRTYQYHGNNFLIDGPYGRSGESLDEEWFHNNLVPVFQNQTWAPTERSLNHNRRQGDWYRKYQNSPTLMLPNRRRTTTLWDFLGENMGPNTSFYGVEPSTGGGGVGYVLNSNNKDFSKKASQQNPIDVDDIESLIKRIKKYRGSMEYKELSLYVEPLIEGSRKHQFKSMHIITLAERLKTLSKRLSRIKKEERKKEVKEKMKNIVDDISEKIKEFKQEKTASKVTKKINWYEKHILYHKEDN